MSLTKSLLIVPIVALSACVHTGMGRAAEEVKLSTASDGIPAARGDVRTGDAANGNTAVTVQVQHLAEPDRVADGATTYVVWAQPQGSDTAQNIGALKVDNNLNGTLSTEVPFDAFKITITAESAPTVTEPNGHQLLSADVHHRPGTGQTPAL